MEFLTASAKTTALDGGNNLESVHLQLEAHKKFEDNQSLLGRIVSSVYSKDDQTKAKLVELEAGGLAQSQFYLASVKNGDIAKAVEADRDAVGTKDTIGHAGSQVIKTAALFSRGPIATGATVLAYALDEIKGSDNSAGSIIADGALGSGKAFLMRTAAEGLNGTQLGTAARGVTLGATFRAVDVGLTRANYLDSDGSFSLSKGLVKTFDSTLSPTALATDAVVFGAGAGLTRGVSKMLGGALERSPVLANGVSASLFGTVSGANAEITRQMNSGKSFSSIDFGDVAKSALLQGGLDFVAGIPGGLQNRAQISRINSEFGASNLRSDLSNVPVRLEHGKVVDVFDKFATEPMLAPAQRTRVLSVLKDVHQNYMDLEAKVPEGSPDRGYQTVNWKHTRNEINEVLEAGRRNGLSKAQMEDALLASIFSDAVKTPANFAVHNIDGAKMAQDVLPKYFDMTNPKNVERVNGIAEAVKEHQIGPPAFMAHMIANVFIKGKLGAGATAEQLDSVKSIYDKIANPFEKQNQTTDGSRINFTAAEQTLLDSIGVKSWTVPHASPWYKASRAVIDGDSIVNYATADGWAKIAAIRGPNKGANFADETVFDSLKSAEASYNDAFSVISKRSRPLAASGLAETKASVDSVRAKMDSWIAREREQFAARGTVDEANPFNADGSLPFWNSPLKYPKENKVSLDGLTPKEQTQFEYAKTIRQKTVDMLRQEQILRLTGGAS